MAESGLSTAHPLDFWLLTAGCFLFCIHFLSPQMSTTDIGKHLIHLLGSLALKKVDLRFAKDLEMRTNTCPKCTHLEAAQYKFLFGGEKR